MFSLRNTDTEQSEKPRQDTSAGEYHDQSDFIPFLIHYSPDTLLTKNGELLKIIKITGNKYGLNYESGHGANTLRDIVRRAIGNSVNSDKYAFWMHTLRRRDPVHHESKYEDYFANYVNEKWREKNNWQQQYHNEIYITVAYSGQPAELFDQQNLKHVVLPDTNRAFRNAYLSESLNKLTDTVDKILNVIRQHYNAECLGVRERLADETLNMPGKTIFYSEPMEFLSMVYNLRPDHFPVTYSTIDKALCSTDLIFGYNALETKTAKGDRRFAGILTLKHYQEVPLSTVDTILQYPSEFIISQSFHYIPAAIATKPYRAQKMIFEMSEDPYSYRQSGLESKMHPNRRKPIDYGRQQTTIMVLVDDFSQLEAEMSRIQQKFAEVGIIVIREDIKLEEAFWSQLPCNFEFIRRQDTIVSPEMAGFCRLNLFPNGSSKNNHWGDALALIPTTVNSPYFFNLHFQDNGHTLLFDYNSFQDSIGTVLLNFLVTTSLKYKPKIFVFDAQQSSRLFFEKANGRYHLLPFGAYKHEGYGLNPFLLENSPRNQSFLLAWCGALIEPLGTINDSQRELLRQAIAELFESGEHQRHMTGFITILERMDVELAQLFSHFHGRGQFAGLFDAHVESLDLSNPMQAFDISDHIIASQLTVPVFSYLTHRIISQLDGVPTIIVLHDALRLLENSFFAPRLESLLEMLKQNNVLVVSTLHHAQELQDSDVLQTLRRSCATRLYLPDDVTQPYSSEHSGLNDYDADMLRRMHRQKGELLLKQEHDSIGLRVSFEHMDDIRAILAGDIKNLIAAGGQFATLPEFY